MNAYEYLLDYNQLDEIIFIQAVDDCKKVCNSLGNLAGWDGSGPPSFNSESIIFNGKNANSAGTFVINRSGSTGRIFDTKGKAYDVAVRCCLLVMKLYFDDSFNIQVGDGNACENWHFAREKIKSVLGI